MVTLCNCTQFTSGNQKVLITLTSLTQDIHSHHLLTVLGAPVGLRNGFQFPLCWEFFCFWLCLHFCLLLSGFSVAVAALSPDSTFGWTPDLICYLVLSKSDLLSARTHLCHQPLHLQILWPAWWGHCLCLHHLWLLISLHGVALTVSLCIINGA